MDILNGNISKYFGFALFWWSL